MGGHFKWPLTAFGTVTIGKCKPDVAIISTILNDYSVRVFSPLTKGTDKNYLAINVAMASAAAPAYFPSYSLNKRTYIDGGLWANDPSIAALTLANESRMIDFKHMRLMHIGNGEKLVGSTKIKHDKIAPARMPYYLVSIHKRHNFQIDTGYSAIFLPRPHLWSMACVLERQYFLWNG